MKQGDILAPLLIMVTQLAAQDLESEFKNNNITILKALVSSKIENIIRKHKNNNMKNMSLTMTLILLCADDGAIPFESRLDAELGFQIINKAFSMCGLTTHASIGNKRSKTKVIFFPRTRAIKQWRHNTNCDRIISQ